MMTTARERTLKAQGKTSVKEVRDNPRQITLLGHEVVLNPFSLTIAEKQRWRECLADLGQYADEADHMMALGYVMILRSDPEFSWEDAKQQITWQVMLDELSKARPAEADHPEV